ncbi:MFS family permease [Nocardia kruczakiae]|uniref:MFS family permease n=1 Tax=Nocardia kruczakiae TaxID=261477 RepID=A0ABU1X9H0_9NOCA|nr:MFS transporter [Nocardia kruczakiae]MDR7166712.1 MFS family permease [Nocardia kruczakiae]
MSEQGTAARPRGVLVPLALAQFICSFAGTNMAVMITDISTDLDADVAGVQLVITLFLLIMAALMIPGGKLTDRYGRKSCFVAGLSIYCVGAILSALAPGLGVLALGNSVLEGVGTALLIPPVYILTTLLFTDTTSRARAFGVVMAMGGIGAAAGPLLGGLIASGLGWRAAFAFQALVVAAILISTRRVRDPLPPDPNRTLDLTGSVLSAAGLVLLVLGILATDNDLRWCAVLIVLAVVVLAGFFLHVRATERRGGEPLVSLSLFRSRISNFGLATQLLQWLILMGTSFVVSAYLQVVRGYDPIGTGVIFTAATVGLLVSSLTAARLARLFTQRTLIMTGFVVVIVGIVVLIALAGRTLNPWAFAPGLLLIGLGLGSMLTPSVNVVQSAFSEEHQGEISGLSRCVSNLGSSLGTAIAGTILVAGLSSHAYAVAMLALGVAGVLGLFAAAGLPHRTPIAQP